MIEPGDPIERILETLRERAKELNCLYAVDARLAAHASPLDEVLHGIVDDLPPGWQYSDVCHARILLEGAAYHHPGFRETPWCQSASIVVQGKTAGRVEVYYSEAMPRADEGPFLKEERKLIETIAERIGHHVLQRRVQAALHERPRADAGGPAPARREWHVIVEFLSITDRQLLARLARKMLNHLCWNGIAEAQELLQRIAPDPAAQDEAPLEDNRPQEKHDLQDPMTLAEATFRIASEHLSETEMVTRIQKWIKDDKASFLLETLENPASTVTDISDALQRYRHIAVDEGDLTRPMQTALRVALVRRFFSDELEVIEAAKRYVRVPDFSEVAQHVVGPAAGHGRLGGKSSGLFLASRILERCEDAAELLSGIRVPRTWYVASDGLLDFIRYNHLEDVYNRKYLDLDQVQREYPHIVQVFKNSRFSPELVRGLSAALDDFGDRPVIVRSSSLLEDRMGAAFSGKYKSLFLANQGEKTARLAALMDAIAEVYASLFGPDPLEYRAERGLLDLHEEMAIMIQEVIGTRVGRYFLPSFSGVAFSNNEFRWSPRIKREDGLVRIVPGLGTRAVDRLGDDFPVLIAPGQPGLRANVSADEVIRYSPKFVDVVDLESEEFASIEVARLLRECGRDLPQVAEIVSVVTPDGVRRPMGFDLDFDSDDLVVTFDGLTTRTPFVATMRALLRLLREKLGVPIDVEFASDGRHLYLLQCRQQSFGSTFADAAIPVDPPAERVLFTAHRYVSNGPVPDLTHIVYVDPAQYKMLGDLAELREVGRAVGHLNKLLPKRQFVLMGPGRWGSRGDIRLGVPVTYSDINNTAMLVEIARKEGQYVPDLSFGTHFFQDLVEASIRYLPLFPDESGVRFHENFLLCSPNVLAELLPEHAHLSEVIRVIDVPAATGGLILKVLLNADRDEAMGLLAPPTPVGDAPSEVRKPAEPVQEAHWRWRHRMAECVAARLDPARFGVKGLYLFGSTKNATARAQSDIDLIVHWDGSEERRRELELWLAGWSDCLREVNFLRTGSETGGELDAHFVTDDDLARQTSYAAKIGAITDAARPLRLAASSG